MKKTRGREIKGRGKSDHFELNDAEKYVQTRFSRKSGRHDQTDISQESSL